MVKRAGDGTVTIDVNAAEEDDVYAGGETTAGSGDWNSVMLTRTDDATKATDIVAIYTDIEAPKPTMLTAEETCGRGKDWYCLILIWMTLVAAFGTVAEQLARIMPDDLPPNTTVGLNYDRKCKVHGDIPRHSRRVYLYL